MRKKDLKTGMVVECKNGNRYLVLVEQNKLIREDGHMNISDYSDDLMLLDYDMFGFGIVSVYNPSWTGITYTLNNCKNPIWKREEEPKEMTIAEIEKELGYPIKVVN